jgi:hypothetical protein
MLKYFMFTLLMKRPLAVGPECGEAILFWVVSMPSDFQLPPNGEFRDVVPTGKPPPSPHTCIFQLWPQGPESRKLTDPLSNIKG